MILTYMKHPYIVELLDLVIPQSHETFTEIYMVMELTESDLKKIAKSTMTLNKT
jgi:serine/threonine protein kinase